MKSRKFGKFSRRNRRYKRRNNNNYSTNIPYAIKQRPTRYGPGKNICVINTIGTSNQATLTRISIDYELRQNAEFTNKSQDFKYYKIKVIRLVLFPSNNSDGLIYINLCWNAISNSLEYLRKDDSTKITSGFRTRNKIFRWLMPRTVLNVNSTSQTVPTNFVDMSQFIAIERNISLPGWLFFYNNTGGPQTYNLEIVVEFRGNDFLPSVELLKEKLFENEVITISPNDTKEVKKEEEKEADNKEEKKEEKKIKKNKHKEKHKLKEKEKEKKNEEEKKEDKSVDWLTDPEDDSD